MSHLFVIPFIEGLVCPRSKYWYQFFVAGTAAAFIFDTNLSDVACLKFTEIYI